MSLSVPLSNVAVVIHSMAGFANLLTNISHDEVVGREVRVHGPVLHETDAAFNGKRRHFCRGIGTELRSSKRLAAEGERNEDDLSTNF